MSDSMGSELSLSVVVRSDQRYRPEMGPEPAYQPEERAEETIVGDLAEQFDHELKRAVDKTKLSLDAIENDLTLALQEAAAGMPGRVTLLASFTSMFRRDPNKEIVEKISLVREARQIAEILDGIADAFPREYDAYRKSVTALNGLLEGSPAYEKFQQSLEQVAKQRGVEVYQVKALMNDAFAKSPEINELRSSLNAVLKDPVIAPVFREVENRYHVVDRMMADVAAGTNRLGREKGLDMSGFRTVADLAEQMAQNLDKPIVSRPGGIQMDGPDNSMGDHLKKLAASIRAMIEGLIQGLRAAFRPAGPSPSP